MNHYPAQHLHDPDPPRHTNQTNSPWSTPGAVERLGELWESHSSSQIANLLSEEFQVTFSRNSVVGKAKRLGLTAPAEPRERKPYTRREPTENKPVLKIIRAAGNSSALRLIYSVETEAAPLRCAEVQPLNLSLADLPDNGCRYIAGDNYLYCGREQQAKSSYCPAHHKLVWLPATPPKRRAA